jgi:ABC-type lipoprotein release transport system permease subunit
MINRGALLWMRADLRQRWRGVVFLALLAGIGFGIVLAALGGARRTESAIDRAVEERRVADAIVQLNTPEAAAVVLDQPQVADGALADMFLGTIEGVAFDASVLVVHGGWGTDFDAIELIAGRRADPTSPHEVVLPAATARAAGVGVGDTLTLHTLSPAQAEQFVGVGIDDGVPLAPGPVIDMRVVGVGGTVTDLVGSEESFIYGTPAFGDRYIETVGHFGVHGIGGGFAAVRLHGGEADLAAFDSDLRAALDVDAASDAFSVQARSATMQNSEAAISTTATGALVFAIAAGIATIAAVGQAVGRHLARSQPEQTTLSALGLPRRTRAAALALGMAPAAAGAAVLAVAGATMASAITPFGVARRFEPDSGIQPDLAVAGIGVAVVIAVVLSIGGLQAWRATRPVTDGAGTNPTVAATIAERAGATPTLTTGVRLAFERRVGRRSTLSRSVLTSGVVGIAAIVGAVSYAASLEETVTDPIRWGWAWDVVVDVDAQRIDEAVAALSELDEVGGVATVTDRQVVVEGQLTRGQSFDVHHGRVPSVVHAGRVPVSRDEVALGTAVSRRLDRDVGDTVTVTTADGPRELTVVGRITSYALDSGGPGDAVLLDPEGLDDVASSEGFASIAISATDGTSTDQLVAALGPLIDTGTVELSVYGYPTRPDRIANASSVSAVTWALAAFAGVLAFVGAAHGIHTTMRRRRGDLAILRALGFRPTDLRVSSFWHGSCIAAVAIAAGIPLGIAAGRMAFRALTDDLGLEGGFVVPPVSLTIIAVSTVVALQLLTGVRGRRAARVSPAEVLRSE